MKPNINLHSPGFRMLWSKIIQYYFEFLASWKSYDERKAALHVRMNNAFPFAQNVCQQCNAITTDLTVVIALHCWSDWEPLITKHFYMNLRKGPKLHCWIQNCPSLICHCLSAGYGHFEKWNILSFDFF